MTTVRTTLTSLLCLVCLLAELALPARAADNGQTPQSIQALFAQLQLQLQREAAEQAAERAEAIQQRQEEQAELNRCLSSLYALRAALREGQPGEEAAAETERLRAFLEERDIPCLTGGVFDCDLAISGVEQRQEDLATAVQSQMTQVQDYIGQYNSCLSGLTEVEQALSGLQGPAGLTGSLYSAAGGTGALALSALAGLLAGMALMWGIGRRRSARERRDDR